MRLRYTPRARADIETIYEYVAQHNKRAAIAIVRQIHLTSRLLAQYPALGRETDIPNVRMFPSVRFPYLVYHQLREVELIVLHVRDGRRAPPDLGEL
jgi:plasmid stabilization system protein ParE